MAAVCSPETSVVPHHRREKEGARAAAPLHWLVDSSLESVEVPTNSATYRSWTVTNYALDASEMDVLIFLCSDLANPVMELNNGNLIGSRYIHHELSCIRD